MNFRVSICVFGLIVLSNLNFIHGQNEVLSCRYMLNSGSYRCDLTIINPNGLNNFTTINGTHLAGMTDDDVRYIYGAIGSNTTNIPSIICDKFSFTLVIEILARGVQIIDEDSFQNCKSLTRLNLKNNKIRQFHKNAFKKNSELQQLLLWYNEITELPEDPFVNLQNLIRLDFEANKISKLPDNIFKPLTKLDILFLERNQIEELPANAFNSLQNMTAFVIHNNKLKIIHASSFGMLPKLKFVDMTNNQIDAIDEKFINNTGVNEFYLRVNVCVNKDITDTTVGRNSMRADLKQCFDNYEEIMSGCSEGDLDNRVCQLESNHEVMVEDVKTLKDENEKMRSEIKSLAKEKQELQENVQNQNKIFAAAIKELEYQMLELKACSCGCQ